MSKRAGFMPSFEPSDLALDWAQKLMRSGIKIFTRFEDWSVGFELPDNATDHQRNLSDRAFEMMIVDPTLGDEVSKLLCELNYFLMTGRQVTA